MKVDIHSKRFKLGQNIKKYRLQKGWSQADLSNAADINRTDISKYENGEKGVMGYERLEKLAKVLNVTTDQLLAEEDEEAVAASGSNIQSMYEQLNASNKAMVDQLVRSLLLQQNTVL